MSFYFAFYLPLFVGLTRVAIHDLRVPVILAAPIVFTGLELARAYLLTGFTMGSIGHTQYLWLDLIQVSDLVGFYGVVFVVAFGAACVARMLPCDGSRFYIWPILPLAAMLGVVLLYGHLRRASVPHPHPQARIALVQGSIDIEMKRDPAKSDQIQVEYRELSRQAMADAAADGRGVQPGGLAGDDVPISYRGLSGERGLADPFRVPGRCGSHAAGNGRSGKGNPVLPAARRGYRGSNRRRVEVPQFGRLRAAHFRSGG